MDEKMIDAVKNWLEAIMPAVVETLVASLTVEAFHEMGKEEDIHGSIAVNLEEFRAPITAINFYTMVVEDGMMVATTADIKGADEDTLTRFICSPTKQVWSSREHLLTNFSTFAKTSITCNFLQ